MRLTHATYLALTRMAFADGELAPQEAKLLERYRIALDLDPSVATRIVDEAADREIDWSSVSATTSQKEHVLRMLVRIACEDGCFLPRERGFLREVAAGIGFSKIEYADLVVSIEQEVGSMASRKQWRNIFIGVGLLIAVFGFFGYKILSSRGERLVQTVKNETEEREKASKDERALADRLAELESQLTVASVALQGEFEKLGREFARSRKNNTVFQEIERDYGDAVLLLAIRYSLVKGVERVQRTSGGTGFFVTPIGHIVTNKHVAVPWMYDADAVRLMDQGYVVDLESVYRWAWPPRTSYKIYGVLSVRRGGFSSVGGTLDLEQTTPDRRCRATYADVDGVNYTSSSYHTAGVSDLAVLKAKVSSPVSVMYLAPDLAYVRKLDPVMLLGYPGGYTRLETKQVEASPCLGEVRKVGEMISVTVPLVGGNSGGPLFNLEGHVIGVASVTYGASTFGGCVPTGHVLSLLPSVSELLLDAEVHEDLGMTRAALDLLELARLRGAEGSELKSRRAPLMAGLTRRLAVVRRLEKDGDHAACRAECDAIVQEYGPRWGRRAVLAAEVLAAEVLGKGIKE